MATQQTLVLVKPDGIVKSLTGNIITALSSPKRKIMGAKIVAVSRELAVEHYRHLKEKPFFEELIKYILGDYHTKRILALVYEGDDVINEVRAIAGATNPEEAHPETIRGKYGRIHSVTNVFENVIHASADETDAEREIKLWFKPEELVSRIYPVAKKKTTKEELVWA
ncbi:nucleoside-diphosphate kinase [Candidatus Woesearchaeota archaeon]|nr:nucleoside-diphosphate kinase [Candidatus Woesearchaeota archaeon]MBW3017463.1 nucleoside-diphosphate kinase [Candidatus Woesearchaeota archaeon]